MEDEAHQQRLKVSGKAKQRTIAEVHPGLDARLASDEGHCLGVVQLHAVRQAALRERAYRCEERNGWRSGVSLVLAWGWRDKGLHEGRRVQTAERAVRSKVSAATPTKAARGGSHPLREGRVCRSLSDRDACLLT